MAAATAPINTPEVSGQFIEGLVVETSTTVYAGTLGALDAGGNVVPASDTAGLIAAGRVETLPNQDTFTAGQAVLIKRGTFMFNNSTANPIGIANIGDLAYCEDDNTVATTTTHLVKAGKIVGIDSTGGIWIDTRVLAPAITPSSTVVSTANATDLASAEALVNALKTQVNNLVADVAALAKQLS